MNHLLFRFINRRLHFDGKVRADDSITDCTVTLEASTGQDDGVRARAAGFNRHFITQYRVGPNDTTTPNLYAVSDHHGWNQRHVVRYVDVLACPNSFFCAG